MAPTPRVIFVRHGETEWSKSGQYTSITDLPLTENGRKRMLSTGKALIGEDRLIHPSHIEKVYVSPRLRAKETLDIMFSTHKEETKNIPVKETDNIQEWKYGDYEGMKTADIRKLRKERGLDKDQEWSIWRDGCENGEMPDQVAARLDQLVDEIVSIQRKAMEENRHSEILIIAHGHILRCLTLRWVKRPICENPSFILEAGGVGVLSYEHHNWQEPAICLGGGFTIPNE